MKILITGLTRGGTTYVGQLFGEYIGIDPWDKTRYFNEPFKRGSALELIEVADSITKPNEAVVKDHVQHYELYEEKTGKNFPFQIYDDFYKIKLIRSNFKEMVMSLAISRTFGYYNDYTTSVRPNLADKKVTIEKQTFVDAFTAQHHNRIQMEKFDSLQYDEIVYYEDLTGDPNIDQHKFKILADNPKTLGDVTVVKRKPYTESISNIEEVEKWYNEMDEKFYIVFRNSSTDEKHKITFKPTGHALSNLWMQTMKSNFLSPNNATNSRPLNKQFCFHAWVTQWIQNKYSRNLRVVCEELNTAIAKVNFYYLPYGYPKIQFDGADGFNPELLQDQQWYRKAMNELHHHFEVLIGQVDNTSEWYYKPNSMVACYYVQQLNSLLHEIEAIVNNIQNNNGERAVLINFNTPNLDGSYEPEAVRHDLTDEHYECFEDIEHKWGMLSCYYSQLGKQHIEVYLDGDDVIGEDNISGIQYMLGECILSLSDNTEDRPRLRPEYIEWLKANNFDHTDKKLALGLGVLANIEGSKEELDDIIRSCDDIYEIGFCIGDYKTAYQTYPYTWQEYQTQLIKNWEENDSISDWDKSHSGH